MSRRRRFPRLHWALLQTYSWGECKQHPWRTLTVVITVALGVALALAVHLINHSAIAEFDRASNQAQGQADWILRSRSEQPIAPGLLRQLNRQDDIALTSPEVLLTAVLPQRQTRANSDLEDNTLALRCIDTLVQGRLNPLLFPKLYPGFSRLDVFSPDVIYLNASALSSWSEPPKTLTIAVGGRLHTLRVAGTIAVPGGPMGVLDIAAAQAIAGMGDRLDKIHIRLRPGAPQRDASAWMTAWNLPSTLYLEAPTDGTQRLEKLTQAYRVNLTVLALIALFTGAFLVFSILSLSIAKRMPQFALLGILGLSHTERLVIVLVESAILGVVGSALGVGLAALLASAALGFLGGDLGSGFFSAAQTRLQWDGAAAAIFMALGVVATLAGGCWPAQRVANMAPVMAIKGLHVQTTRHRHRQFAMGAALLVISAVLCALPPWGSLPLGAYIGIALLLLGAMICLPPAVTTVVAKLSARTTHRLMPMLALARAQRIPHAGATAVSGVVTSLALAVALTVMVGSFRYSVTSWLDTVLPADIYLRITDSNSQRDARYFSASFETALRQIDGIQSLRSQRVTPVILDSERPAVTVLARDLPLNSAGEPTDIPLVVSANDSSTANALGSADRYPVWVSEASRDAFGLRLNQPFTALEQALPGKTPIVVGVWRDYARQTGSVVMKLSDFRALTQDGRITDIGLTLAPTASDTAVLRDVTRVFQQVHAGARAAELEIAQARSIRQISLEIFDRSFAVTTWLQGVAIAIGLFGVASSFSAQVLARQREFGMLSHLGFTRRRIQTLVVGEGLVWSVIGAVFGALLGLVVSAILVYVVNPQSFHWSMDWQVPWGRLLSLIVAVIVTGTVTCAWVARRALNQSAVQSVKQDW